MAKTADGSRRFLSTPSARRATWRKMLLSPRPPISIHALREEGDAEPSSFRAVQKYFYPRPPRGGRQNADCDCSGDCQFLSTPSARRATVVLVWSRNSSEGFLSTPSARRATPRRHYEAGHRDHFYPRPPRGGRPAGLGFQQLLRDISIHALREEGDVVLSMSTMHSHLFLSTPSARRATSHHCRFAATLPISIHALREEGDAV